MTLNSKLRFRTMVPFSCIQYECLVEGCDQKFARDRDRKKHLVRFHQYPEGMSMQHTC